MRKIYNDISGVLHWYVDVEIMLVFRRKCCVHCFPVVVSVTDINSCVSHLIVEVEISSQFF
jgi:hypothetical protein